MRQGGYRLICSCRFGFVGLFWVVEKPVFKELYHPKKYIPYTIINNGTKIDLIVNILIYNCRIFKQQS